MKLDMDQGSLGKGDLQIGEVSNNVFVHYVQINRDIFPYDASWLGKLPNIEEKHNKVRLEGGTFLNLEIHGRLYFVINFLNAFEGPETYAHIATLYRKNVNEGIQMSTQDVWALGIYDKYGISLVDYFEAWGIEVSEDARVKIEQGNSKNMFSLKDLVVDKDLVNKIKSDLNFECNYHLVISEQLSSYNIKGSSKVNIEIDNIDLLQGKYIQLKDGKKEVAKVKIDESTIKLPDVPVGVYKLVVPELVGEYSNNSGSVIISNFKETEFNLVYKNINTGNKFENHVKVQFQGRYYNDAAEVKLVNDNGNLKLNLRYRGTTLFNAGLAADTEYAKIQVLNTDEQEVYSKIVKGKNQIFSTKNNEEFNVEVGIGYKLVLKYGNSDAKLKFISNLNNDYRTIYEIPKNQDRTFIITKEGLKPESISNEAFYDEYTQRMKTYIDNFEKSVTEDEIYSKYFYKDIKAIIVNGYKKMNESDKQFYQDIYNKIVNGHSPVITSLSDNVEVKINENIDLTKLVEVNDVEDGKIDISDINIKTNLDTKKLGAYTVTDTDNNTSTKTITIQVVKHDYDSLELEELIREIEILEQSQYEEKTFESLQQALIISKETLLRDDVTQYMINEQITILRKCLSNLKKIYKVTFNYDDESETTKIINVVENSKIEKSETPIRDGFIFKGWYKDKEYKQKWIFAINVVKEETTLYAKWKEQQEPIVPPTDDEEVDEPIVPQWLMKK